MCQKSLEKYLSYSIPKYKEIVQISFMLLGHPKNELNMPKSNKLNHRKVISEQIMKRLIE